MFQDISGRVIVPVGVAYGSDTGLVRELMLEVANSHPGVITDGSVPKPLVLFIEFGDSSLNFELRCFIRNIDYRLTTRSDLNFAIDAIFRKHGVEIPFPQRDVHVRDWANIPKGEVRPK
jgi:small-conductance mechanosensitive channel